LYACIATSLANLLIVGLLSLTFYRENGKADRGEKELEADEVRLDPRIPTRMSEKMADEFPQEDFQPGFRYTY
jgi:hypothetical protein